jgi:mitochondrial cardiolipin hydrolase
MHDPRDRDVARWLYDVLGLLRPEATTKVRAEVLFSPRDACCERLCRLLQGARKSVDVCVFTITDDRIAEAMLRAHDRGVQLRVISDAMKTLDEGSDVGRLARAGVAVSLDTPDKHMHHKFAVFDRRVLVTGSYNWTRSASTRNDENLVVSGDPRLVESFADEFARLWEKYERG